MSYPQSKADEFKAYLKDYLKTDKEIELIKTAMNESFTNQDYLNQKLAQLQEQKQEISIVMKYEFKINIQNELDSGRTPLQIMQGVRKQYPEYEPVRVTNPDSIDDRQKVKDMEHPINPPAIDLAKLAKDRKEEAEKPKEEQKPQEPSVSETLTVTHHTAPHRAIDRFLDHMKKNQEPPQEPRRGHKHDM